MAPKKQTKKDPKIVSKQVTSTTDLTGKAEGDEHMRIIAMLCAKGVSKEAAQAAFDKLWKEGMDTGDEKLCFETVLKFIKQDGKTRTQSIPKPVEISKPVEETPIQKKQALLQTLKKVAALTNICEVIDGLTRWFKQSSKEDQEVLTSSDIPESIITSYMRDRKQRVNDTIIGNFFTIIYAFPNVIAKSLVQMISSVKENIPDLSMPQDAIVSLVLHAIRSCPSPINASAQAKLASARVTIRDLSVLSEQTTVTDGRSLFSARDIRHDLFNSLLDAQEVLSTHELASQDSTATLADAVTMLPFPEGGDKVKVELQSLTSELSNAKVDFEKRTADLVTRESELSNTVNDLMAKKSSLEKELNEISNKLRNASSDLDIVRTGLSNEQNKYDQTNTVIKEKRNSVSEVAKQMFARDSVVESLNSLDSAVKNAVGEMTSSTSEECSQNKANLFKTAVAYIQKECECVLFLRRRQQSSETQIAALSKDIEQLLGLELYHSAEEPQRQLLKLKQLAASDTGAANSLTQLACECEKRLSVLVGKEKTMLSSYGEMLGKFYGYFNLIGCNRQIKPALYNSITSFIPRISESNVLLSLPSALPVTTTVPATQSTVPATQSTVPADTIALAKAKLVDAPKQKPVATSKPTPSESSKAKLSWGQKISPERIISLEEIQREAIGKKLV